MDYILNIENLSKKYEGFTLQEVNFAIPKGVIMGLVGENGAGKTTIIKLILNLIKKDAGKIQVFGLDYLQEELEIKERIGVVLDESGFYGDLRGKDIDLIMSNIYKNWSHSDFSYFMEKFELPFNKPIKDLSKGMKIKLSIAIAMSHKPDLLILDEPTSGLDPIVRNEILDIFLEFIQDEEKSILFSTHITSDLDKIADYITFVHRGKIVFSKDREELLDNYGVVKCRQEDLVKLDKEIVVGSQQNRYSHEVLIKDKQLAQVKYKDMIIDPVNIEEIMLFYIRGGIR
ncbi:MAG: ABC transporter ATP-binding protein [Firmicutes bacterium]|jgi:ABC-2 type transport system ATP-binding protein|nr:ABC transporter ATP-binding protein [Bacillota bacterium]